MDYFVRNMHEGFSDFVRTTNRTALLTVKKSQVLLKKNPHILIRIIF
jgi:hypothetical protein